MNTSSNASDAPEQQGSAPSSARPHQANALPSLSATVRDLAAQATWFNGDGRMRGTRDPADIKHDNTRLAGFGAHALAQAAIRAGAWSPKNRLSLDLSTGPEPESALRHLATWLRHTADSLGLNYEEIDVQAHRDYLTQVRDNR